MPSHRLTCTPQPSVLLTQHLSSPGNFPVVFYQNKLHSSLTCCEWCPSESVEVHLVLIASEYDSLLSIRRKDRLSDSEHALPNHGFSIITSRSTSDAVREVNDCRTLSG